MPHPAVRRRVRGRRREDVPGDKRLVAYVVVRRGCEPDAEELRDSPQDDAARLHGAGASSCVSTRCR